MPFNDKKVRIATNAELLARLLLGGIFVYSSFHKIADPAQFVRIICGYDLFPSLTVHPIAIVCPFFELILGVSLILGIYPRGAILIVNVLLLMFITIIAINLARGHQFDCGCFSFSHDSSSSAVWLLIRDIVYLVLGLYILFFGWQRKSFLHINIGPDKKIS